MVKEDEHWHLVQQDSWSLGVGSHNNKQVLRGLSRFKQQISVPKLCSVCHVSTSVMFCKAHDSHLCRACDAKIHGSSPTSTSSSPASSCHEREWLCDVCEQAPAVVSCKADAASLCVNCDNDIHSANPLASRHERLPVTPFHGFSLEPTSNLNSTSHGCHSVECNLSINNNLECTNFLNENGGEEGEESPGQQQLETQEGTNNNTNLRGGREHCYHHEDGVVSWMLPPDSSKSNQLSLVSAAVSGGDDRSVKDKLKFKAYLQSIDFLQDVDSYVDLEYLASSNTSTAPILTSAAASTGPQVGTDSMVPVHTPEVYDHSSSKHSNESGGSLDVDAYKSNYGYRVGSLNQCVPSASLDVGIVPDSQKPNGSQSPFHEAATRTFDMVQRVSQVGDQVEHLMGREARVLRYREKRKNRKFEKTIRYASRKAYAETRPRIKGRFAKRTDVEINGIYPSSSPSPLLPDQQQLDVVSTF